METPSKSLGGIIWFSITQAQPIVLSLRSYAGLWSTPINLLLCGIPLLNPPLIPLLPPALSERRCESVGSWEAASTWACTWHHSQHGGCSDCPGQGASSGIPDQDLRETFQHVHLTCPRRVPLSLVLPFCALPTAVPIAGEAVDTAQPLSTPDTGPGMLRYRMHLMAAWSSVEWVGKVITQGQGP